MTSGVDRVILYRTPLSWSELATATNRFYNFAHFLYGVLEHFDTPDLTRTLPEEKLIWVNGTNGNGCVVPLSYAKKVHRGAKTIFKHARVVPEMSSILKKK